jgi:hypothetical protein
VRIVNTGKELDNLPGEDAQDLVTAELVIELKHYLVTKEGHMSQLILTTPEMFLVVAYS